MKDKQLALYDRLLRLHYKLFFENIAKELDTKDIDTFVQQCFASIATLSANVTDMLCRSYNITPDSLANVFLHMYGASLKSITEKEQEPMH